MAWRGVHISRSARLSVRHRQLVLAGEEGEISLPLEDIAWLVLDTPQVTITGGALSALTEAGVVMIVPDATHHPAGILLPFHRHYAQAHVAYLQVGIGLPLRKRMWQVLVVAKIRNQAGLLDQLDRPAAKALSAMAARVVSGDPDNIEAQAARAYWSALFRGFARGDGEDRRNALLNYGYAILRAAIARACAASGLLPAFGIHHASKTNGFNLADDLIEPFRPFVDLAAHERAEAEDGAPSLEDRRHMAAVLNRTVGFGTDRMTILAATEAVGMSAVRAMEHNSAALLVTPAWADGAP